MLKFASASARERLTLGRRVVQAAVKVTKISETDVAFAERANGMGTIIFRPQDPFAWMYGGMGRFGLPSLEMIEDARRVYKIIRDAR